MARARLPGLRAQLLDEGNPPSISMENALGNGHVAPRPRSKTPQRLQVSGGRQKGPAPGVKAGDRRELRPLAPSCDRLSFLDGVQRQPWKQSVGKHALGRAWEKGWRPPELPAKPRSQLKAPLPTAERFLLGSVPQNQRVSPPQNSSQYLEMRNKDSISRSHLPTSPRSQTNVGHAWFGLLNVLAEFSRLLQTERSSSVSDPTHREGQWDAILG